jgi:hypothetical protein
MLNTEEVAGVPASRPTQPVDVCKRFRRFCQERGISFATGYRHIRAGKLKARKLGGATVIYREDELAFDAQWPTL